MLADEVIGFAKHPMYKVIMPELRFGYLALANDVANAQRFILTRDAVFLIHTVSNISATRLLQALQICRMPFPRMWVEFVYRDRDDWHNLVNMKRNTMENATAPSRLGFLLEQKDADGRIIQVTLVWKHNNDPSYEHHETIIIGGFDMTLNTNEGVMVTDELRENWHRAQADPDALEQRFSKTLPANDAEKEATLELEARLKTNFCLYMSPFWAHMRQHFPQEEDRLSQNSLFDLLQEWRFILGLLTVLNSRNLIDYSEPVSFDKINKARLKKDKTASLLHDHREIRLAFSRVQRNRMGGTSHDLKAHLVRGHYKLRRSRTGEVRLFWWSHFVRGTGEPTNKPYLVRT